MLPASTDAPAPVENARPKEIVCLVSVIQAVEPFKPEAPAKERSPGPKEVAWSESLLPPSADGIAAEETDRALVSTNREHLAIEDLHAEPHGPDLDHEPSYANDDDIVRPRKKKSRLALLVVLIFIALGSFGAGGYFVVRYVNDARPERLWVKANKEYDQKKASRTCPQAVRRFCQELSQ